MLKLIGYVHNYVGISKIRLFGGRLNEAHNVFLAKCFGTKKQETSKPNVWLKGNELLALQNVIEVVIALDPNG